MKCPSCNSKKIRKTEFGSYCRNCNYINQKINAPNLTCDIHNNGFKFKIIKDNPDVHFHRIEGMRGWTPEIFKTENFTIKRNKTCVEFFYRKRISCKLRDSKHILENIKKKFIEEAKIFTADYNIILDLNPIPLKRRPEIKVSEITSAINFNTSRMKAVYPKPSAIETHGNKAVEDVIRFTNNMLVKDYGEHIDKRFDQLIEIDKKFADNLELHLDVLKNIKKAVYDLNKNIKIISRFIKKITIVFQLPRLVFRKLCSFGKDFLKDDLT